MPSDPIQVGVAAEFIVRTKDQDGKLVFVESMKVSWRREKRGRGVCSLDEAYRNCGILICILATGGGEGSVDGGRGGG